MELAAHITDLITVATEMRNVDGADKKAINKTISKLQDARLWAKEIQTPAAVNASRCTCPDGATDLSCPQHGNK